MYGLADFLSPMCLQTGSARWPVLAVVNQRPCVYHRSCPAPCRARGWLDVLSLIARWGFQHLGAWIARSRRLDCSADKCHLGSGRGAILAVRSAHERHKLPPHWPRRFLNTILNTSLSSRALGVRNADTSRLRFATTLCDLCSTSPKHS